MSLYRDEAIVLRTQKLGEADRIVTMLGRRSGRVRAVAKGVRRTMSKFGSRLEPFTHVDLQLYEGRSLDIVTQAESLRPYGERIATDYVRYTAGTAMLETTERLTPVEREPSLQLFLLLVGGLRTLAAGAHTPGLVLDSFLLRALAVAGWPPALVSCALCATEGPHKWFSVSSGGSVCSDCRPAGSASLAPATATLLGALLAGQWEVADASDQRHRREATGLVAAYLQWHVENGVRSLRMVERA